MDNIEYLCIGDEVALLVVAEDTAFPNVGYVSVQMGMDTVFVEYLTGGTGRNGHGAIMVPAPLHPRRVRFTIKPVMSLKEAKALAEAQAVASKLSLLRKLVPSNLRTQAQEVASKQSLRELEVAAEREAKANDDDFHRFTGTPVLFGQQVQLFHEPSNSTIGIMEDHAEVAQDDNTYTDIQLLNQQRVAAIQVNGKGSGFRILPGYATCHEGNKVKYGDVIILTSPAVSASLHARRMGTTAKVVSIEDIHSADREAIVGSGQLKTCFRTVPISKFSYSKAVNPVMLNTQLFGGSFVHLCHKATGTIITLDSTVTPASMSEDETIRQTVSMGKDEKDGQFRVTQSWCLQQVDLSWSGQQILGGSLMLIKHGLASSVLLCSEDGKLSVGKNYKSSDAHWKIIPYDEKLTILQVTDAFVLGSPRPV